MKRKTETNEVDNILQENDRRNAVMYAKFDPVTGEGSTGERVRVEISDFPIPVQWIPAAMAKVPLAAKVVHFGSIREFIHRTFHTQLDSERYEREFTQITKLLIYMRFCHDFAFWAAVLVYIHNKSAGQDVLFRLFYPQRILVSVFERMRLAGKPIRLILLKARQWGGSTTTQLYMAWLQIFHRKGLNSLIIAHQGTASDEIKDMFDRMLKDYPVEYLHQPGEQFSPGEDKMETVGKSGSTFRIPQRNCKVKVGTAERPDGCRGGAYSLVHLSEVGLWKKTDGKSPEDIVRSACSGILAEPYTMIVMESTANGTGNFFHREYTAAADPRINSQFEALFIAWFQIEHYSRSFETDEDKRDFAERLWQDKDNPNVASEREESGQYLWSLWTKGASLEAINWYIYERSGKNSFAVMASEYPSDDIEAFVHSGAMVFDRYLVEKFRKFCRPPRCIGEVVGRSREGEDALESIQFREDRQGQLMIWSMPEMFADGEYSDRYLTVVDVGGRSDKADWSVIVVFDRLGMADGSEPPSVVAQWYGHCDIDILAWKAAQIAAFYNESLLVIESNTLETHDRERQIEGGDQSQYILNQVSGVYPNLYARRQSEDEIRQGLPRKYGFHTNIATKPMVISTLVKAIREGLYIERDERCLDEYDTYERKQNGAYGAIDGKHDDLLMTRAIGLHICYYEMETPVFVPAVAKTKRKHRELFTEASV